MATSGGDDLIQRGPPLPERPPGITLGELLAVYLRNHGDADALVDATSGAHQTFNELLDRSHKLIRVLLSYGFKKGDVVAICSENNLAYSTPLLASLQAGYISALLNPQYTPREMEHVLKLTKPKVIFYSKYSSRSVLDAAKTVSPQPKLLCNLDDEFEKLLLSKNGESSIDISKLDVNSDDIAFVLTSSGTTGLPKGVALTHDNLLNSISALGHPDFAADDEGETGMIAYLPFFHAFGLHIMIGSFIRGVTMIVMKRFDIERFLQLVQDYKIKTLLLVPPILALLTQHPSVSKYDLSSVRTIGCGAAPLGAELQTAIKGRMSGIQAIAQAYGLTEATLSVTRIPVHKNKMGSSGIVAPGVEIKVIDPDSGRVLGANEPGEILVRGSTVMKGYYGNPKATAEAIDRDGWLHTGDIGYYDEEGFFFIIDRLKELIKYKGYQVAPAELEGLILSHPSVSDVAVIGIPDKMAGELPKAFVVKKTPVTEQEIIDFVSANVSPQKHLRGGVQFIEAIPKTSTGKILRRELRNLRAKM